MKLHLEPTPGDSINDFAERAQKIADMNDVTVKFRFNGQECMAAPGGRSDWLVTNYHRPKNHNFVSSNRKPETEQQYPPAGVFIQIHKDGVWQMARAFNSDGIAEFGLSYVDLRRIDWRYPIAPSAWPKWAKTHLVLETGENVFCTVNFEVGDPYPLENSTARRVVHVEHRPEWK